MSGKSCIQKTNDEVFGALGEVIKVALTTTKGLKKLAFGIFVLSVIGIEVVLGMNLAVTIAESTNRSGFFFTGALLATMVIAILTLIYLVTLYDNCNPKDVESE